MIDIVKLGQAIRDVALVMVKEESFQSVGITLPSYKMSREDVEFISFMATKEIPCRIYYEWANGNPMVVIARK